MANERLPYVLDFQNGAEVEAILKKAQELPTKNELDLALSSKADLDEDGLIPASEVPPMALEHMKAVQDIAAMYNLTIEDVQNGDTVYLNDTKVMYLVIDDTKLDQAAGYKEYSAGVAAKAVCDEDGNNIKTTYQAKIDSNNKLSADLSALPSWTPGSASTHSTPAANDTVLQALQKIDNNQRNDETNISSVENIIISNQKRSVGFEQGVLDTDTGREYTSNTRIRTGYIETELIKIIPDSETKYLYVLYDSNNNYVPYSSTWATTANTINLKEYGAAKIRICVAKTDDTSIDTNYASHISIYTNERLFNGTLEDLLIKDVNDCGNDGYYTVKAATAPTISNYPSNFTSRAGVIQVYRNLTTNNKHTRFQIVTASNGASAFRYIRDDGTTGDWAYSDKTGFNWIALGDSITEGYYSTAPNTYAITDRNWVRIASELMGCTVTNSGVGGSGYMDNTHATDNKNAKEKVNTINFSNYDVVTLAYGLNDWKYGYPLGDMQDSVSGGSSVIANMRYCIEKIISDNPLCKIIVVTPINCRGYDFSYGDESTNYGIGYTIADNGKTLQDFYDGMKTVCEYYGIDMIDLTHNSIVNRKSIVNLLKDGVHPSLDCHSAIGHEMAKRIAYD